MFPPLYFVFPFMLLSQIYFADTLGPAVGAAVLQALKVQVRKGSTSINLPLPLKMIPRT
jgi:hypothetical protein